MNAKRTRTGAISKMTAEEKAQIEMLGGGIYSDELPTNARAFIEQCPELSGSACEIGRAFGRYGVRRKMHPPSASEEAKWAAGLIALSAELRARLDHMPPVLTARADEASCQFFALQQRLCGDLLKVEQVMRLVPKDKGSAGAPRKAARDELCRDILALLPKDITLVRQAEVIRKLFGTLSVHWPVDTKKQRHILNTL
ncbi:hypothetical protein [Rhodanobacter lindaniclasticus]